jgi:dipeptidyl aminopeptidase/acylaminoacyl peptidase
VDAANPELAPDGSSILFVKDGQIFRARLTQAKPASDVDRGEKPFIKEWGVQSDPKWSPDGKKIAFVSTRADHSFIVVYDMVTRTAKYMAPSVDFDTNPMWVADSKHLIFMRQPGLAFGQQTLQTGAGSGANYAVLPQMTVPAAAATLAGRGGRGGQPGRGGQTAETPVLNNTPGINDAVFRGGYTIEFYRADVTTGDAQETWHNLPKDPIASEISNARLAGDLVIFPFNVGGGRGGRGGRGGTGRAETEARPSASSGIRTPPSSPAPVDEWERYYSLNVSDSKARPLLLTTTDGLIENQQSIAVSADGKTFYYCTNAKDIERRHIWAVPVTGGTPVRITTGEAVETYPAPLASGKYLATLSADWNMPQSVGVWKMAAEGPPAAAVSQKIVFPSLSGFPKDLHVKPEIVMTKADDGLEIHNQLFLPKDLKPGERRPAIVFVHGGPPRQMMPAYHYMQFYHWAYGINQWLANQGYIVMSINYRLGVGYGRSFRNAANGGANGNSEYKDVLAGGKYLQTRPDVDPNRIGIWGLSYGGLLTSEALARNSDIFKAGVDLAGVHLEGNSLDPESVSYKSSAISAIDSWKSPVLLVQGDDDRNVSFLQTVGLVQLLRQRDVYYELIVFPDDVHESLLHSRWMYTLGRMETFLHKFLWDVPTGGSN